MPGAATPRRACCRFCYRFSGENRAFQGTEAGTDAREVTVSGQVDRNRYPSGTDSGPLRRFMFTLIFGLEERLKRPVVTQGREPRIHVDLN
jgi:hypothetical protein